MAVPSGKPAFDEYTADEEIDKLLGKGAAAAFRKQLLEKQQAYLAGGGNTGAANAPMLPQRGPKNEMRPLPSSRATGGTRKRGESDLEFRFRMNQGLPKGARSGAGGGLDEQLFIDEGMAPEAARRKALILRSEGGEAFRDKEGKLQMRGRDARKEVTSSTGRAYDPVAARKAFLANARTAIKAKKQEQAGQQFDDLAKASRAMQLGNVRGIANQYGWGEGKTVLRDAPRPAATTRVNRTLTPQEFSRRNTDPAILRDRGQVNVPLSDEVQFMKDDQAAELAKYKERQAQQALAKPQSKGFASLFSRR